MSYRQKGIRDHARNRSQPNIDNQAISQQLEDLLKPCIYNQLAYYRSLGMRARILSLPLMLAAVLTLVWRQVPSVRELNRMLAREDLLWAKVTKVSQQALSQRLLTFPASMFERVLADLLVTLNQRWHLRNKRTVPLSMAHASQYFEQIWIVDASNPLRGFASEAVGELQFAEALFRKLKSLEDSTLGKLGGRICAVVDLKTRYPIQTWFNERPYAHESNFIPNLLERALERTASEAVGVPKALTPKTLLLLDRGFWNYGLFEQLTQKRADFITRLKSNAQYESISILSQSATHKDTLIRLGTGYQGNPILELRLIEIRHGRSWYRYLIPILHEDALN